MTNREQRRLAQEKPNPYSIMYRYRFELIGDTDAKVHYEIYDRETDELLKKTALRDCLKAAQQDCLAWLKERAQEAQTAVGSA